MAKAEKICEVAIKDLRPYDKNAKVHSDEQVDMICNSIEEFGFISPCLIDKDNRIIAGHGRVMAAKKLGLKKVPCVYIEGLTEEQYKAYILVDNKLTELGGWDFDLLNSELDDIDLDMSQFGFDIETDNEAVDIVEDEIPETPKKAKSKLGQIYQLGEHRLMCGDSTNADDVAELMNGKLADMVFTDPPYNVDYEGVDGIREKIANDHFESDEDAGRELWLPAFENMRAHANDVCSLYCCMPQGSTHMMMMMMMMMRAGWQVKHEIIWRKQSIVLNRADYNYQHEPIAYGWNVTHKFYGKGKYHTTSVWEYDRPTKSKEHPTMKPVELICEALLNSSKKGDIVIDLFGGSGSTLIACEQTDRICYMMELDPHYVDVIIERWETFTGKKARKVNG